MDLRKRMFFFSIILAVSLLSLFDPCVSSDCHEDCEDKPVFTPSRVIVKYGDPASARCSVCQSACIGSLFGIEKSVGISTENGTTISWTVDSLTEWGTNPLCFYNDPHVDRQCCSKLPVIVYQPPDNVSLSVEHHTGPMLEGRQYTLRCWVQNVAPAGNLIVTFYREQTALGHLQSKNGQQHKPVNESFSLNITTTKEDDGAMYWCEAKLEFGAEGPQLPPAMKSQNMVATVHYKPHPQGSSGPDPIHVSIKEGETLQLNCSSVANPTPSYTWTLPSHQTSHINYSIFTISSVMSEHGGRYTCTVINAVGNATMTFQVDVQVDNLGYIITGIILAVVLISIIGAIVYSKYYKDNRMGQYNLKDVFRFHRQHSSVPNTE